MSPYLRSICPPSFEAKQLRYPIKAVTRRREDCQVYQAVEKGSPASLLSIALALTYYKYASARRFLARLASETFLNGLNHRRVKKFTASKNR